MLTTMWCKMMMFKYIPVITMLISLSMNFENDKCSSFQAPLYSLFVPYLFKNPDTTLLYGFLLNNIVT